MRRRTFNFPCSIPFNQIRTQSNCLSCWCVEQMYSSLNNCFPIEKGCDILCHCHHQSHLARFISEVPIFTHRLDCSAHYEHGFPTFYANFVESNWQNQIHFSPFLLSHRIQCLPCIPKTNYFLIAN